MSQRIVTPIANGVAEEAARLTVDALNRALAAKGEALWVLAGGTAPTATYQLLADKYADAVDWSRVKLLIGDERCVPTDHADANWRQIDQVFIRRLNFSPSQLLRPEAELGPDTAAHDYQTVLQGLPRTEAGVPQFDLVWLGMGEDGHTLSLFPGHPEVDNDQQLVIPVFDSPKPPPERLSLTLRALQATKVCLIMATGAGKAPILRRIAAGDHSLPVFRAAETIENNGGSVYWLHDSAAAQA